MYLNTTSYDEYKFLFQNFYQKLTLAIKTIPKEYYHKIALRLAQSISTRDLTL